MPEGFDEMEKIDREKLIDDMQQSLSLIMDKAGWSKDALSKFSGISADKIHMPKNRAKAARRLKWSEYLTLLFIFWKNARVRNIVEEKGLFPKELRSVLSVNRNAHNL